MLYGVNWFISSDYMYFSTLFPTALQAIGPGSSFFLMPRVLSSRHNSELPPLLGSRMGFGGIKFWQEGRASPNPYGHHSNHVLWTVKKIYKEPVMG